jgi:hypothetical protein
MHAMTRQGSINNMETRRDPLVGNYFIVRGEDGRPTKAGRIRSSKIPDASPCFPFIFSSAQRILMQITPPCSRSMAGSKSGCSGMRFSL